MLTEAQADEQIEKAFEFAEQINSLLLAVKTDHTELYLLILFRLFATSLNRLGYSERDLQYELSMAVAGHYFPRREVIKH